MLGVLSRYISFNYRPPPSGFSEITVLISTFTKYRSEKGARSCASSSLLLLQTKPRRRCPPSNLHTGGAGGRGSVSIHQITPISPNPDAQSFHFTPPTPGPVGALVFYTVVPHWRKHGGINPRHRRRWEGKIRGFGPPRCLLLSVCDVNLSEENPIHARLLLHLSERERGQLGPAGSSHLPKHQLEVQAPKVSSCSFSLNWNMLELSARLVISSPSQGRETQVAFRC